MGHYVGRGEIDRQLMGVGVPILRANGEVAASLTTIFPLQELTPKQMEKFVRVTRAAADEIAAGLNKE